MAGKGDAAGMENVKLKAQLQSVVTERGMLEANIEQLEEDMRRLIAEKELVGRSDLLSGRMF